MTERRSTPTVPPSLPGRLRAARVALTRTALSGLVLLVASACAEVPAGGGERFTALMSPEQESQIGAEQHPQILRAFGGEYQDPELQRYIDQIGKRLAARSELPNLDWRFTVLDTDAVNAMALPGGYVYITRGLLSLAENEAEVAGVLAHEIGHVTARHAASRQSWGVVAGLGAAILGILTDSPQLADLASVGAQAGLQTYSREQEFEADELGNRYLTMAGYAPATMVTFFEKLQAHTRLEATLAGNPEAADQYSIMASHPRTADRIQRAIRASNVRLEGEPLVNRDLYLSKIQGMVYGESPEEGVVRGRAFIHPDLRFRFEVPQGFTLVNGADKVVAGGPGGSAIVFDAAPRRTGDMVAFLRRNWAPNAALSDVQSLTVEGMPAATATARARGQRGPMDVRFVAIDGSDRVYRFLFLTPPELTGRLSEELRRTTYSFRRLSPEEAAAIKPLRIQVVTAGPGDTVQSLAARMAIERAPEEHFRILNGLLDPGQPVQPGRKIKIVTEG